MALPSGKLSIKADDNIALGAGSRIDLAGREVRLFDQLRYSWGGDLELQSMAGDITQARARSSTCRRATTAPAACRPSRWATRRVASTWSGTLRATASAAMTRAARWCRMKAAKPCCAGADRLRQLNARLTEGGFFGARRFQISAAT